MIKTPVRKGIWNGQWPILDVRGTVRLHVHREEDADQIVAALNAQPKCETCGDSKWVDVDGQSGAEMEALGNPPLEHIPCPSCQQPSGDCAKAINDLCELFDGAVVNISEPYATYLTSLIAKAKQAAARISALEGANRWIPVSERLPEKREYIIVASNNVKSSGCSKTRPEVMYWTNTNREAERLKTFFTHWKPIVLPDALGKKGQE